MRMCHIILYTDKVENLVGHINPICTCFMSAGVLIISLLASLIFEYVFLAAFIKVEENISEDRLHTAGI